MNSCFLLNYDGLAARESKLAGYSTNYYQLVSNYGLSISNIDMELLMGHTLLLVSCSNISFKRNLFLIIAIFAIYSVVDI